VISQPKNYFLTLFNSKSGLVLLGFITIIYCSTVNFHFVRTDDDVLGEQVYWLDKVGYVKSELMRGYNNIRIEEHQTVFHKLFIYQALLFVKILGWSLPVLHTVSLFYSILFFTILFYYLRSKFPHYKEMFFFIVCAFLLHHNFAWFSSGFRPEIMLMTLGFISFILLEKYLSDKKFRYLLLGGVFAGLGFLTHLNGLIFIAGGGILLLANRQIIPALLFGFTAATVFSIFFIDIFYFTSLDFFWFQFRNDPALHKSNFSLFSPLLKLRDEPMRFFHSEKEIIYSIPVLLSLILAFKYLKQAHRNLLIYTAALAFTLGIYTYSKSTKYLILYLPFIMIIMAEGWAYLEQEGSNAKKIILRTFILIYFVYSIVLSGIRGLDNFKTGSIENYTHSLSEYISGNNQNILAPPYYIFNEIKDDNRIMGIIRFAYIPESHGYPVINLSQLLDSAKAYQINYIILDDFHFTHFNAGRDLKDTDKRYHVVFKEKNAAILKLNQDIK
jgi:hypothetical protein